VEALISLSPGNIPRLNEIRLDGWVLAFTFGISLFTGLIFGLIPAVQASRFNLNETLKEAGRGSSDTAHGGRVRSVLVVAEMALALVLLVGAGLMVRSFMQLHQVDPGFRPDRVLAIEFLLPRAKYADEAGQTSFYTQLLSRVSNLSGVETAGLGEALPLSGGVNMIAFSIEGRPQLQPTDNTPDAEYRVVSSGYFNTLGIPLVRGRLFNEQDSRDTPIVMVINETLARRHFPGEDPIGKRINLGNPNTSPWRTIVGIVADTRHKGLQEDPYPQMYGDYTQLARSSLTLVARTSSDPMSLVGAIRSQVQEMDKDQPLYNVRTMEQVLSNSIARPRFYMTLIAIFAGVAMVLAAVGIYGVISYSVTQRSHELGVRMALGANAGDIFKLVIKQGMALALIGVGLGVVGAFALTRLMESMLFKVSATDPVTFAVISLALIGVALVACFVPARRATKVDPMVALRYE
jgi:putative ABC transport system permease protein